MTDTLSLSSLLVPTKEVEVEYPGMPGFILKLTFLSREALQSIRKKATVTTFKARGTPLEELNDDLFLKLYVAATVKGWKGFKLEYLERLAPVDIGSKDPQSELPFSEDNALMITKSSSDFDAFVSDIVNDLGNFRKVSSAK